MNDKNNVVTAEEIDPTQQVIESNPTAVNVQQVKKKRPETPMIVPLIMALVCWAIALPLFMLAAQDIYISEKPHDPTSLDGLAGIIGTILLFIAVGPFAAGIGFFAWFLSIKKNKNQPKV